MKILLILLWLLAVSNASAAVNGACGSAAGLVVESAPSTGLCSSGIASAVSTRTGFTWVCIGIGGGTSADCSSSTAPIEPETPICGPGEIFGGGDANWSPLTHTQIFPSTPIAATGDAGTAIKFVADPNAPAPYGPYPNGVQMDVFDQSGNADGKDAVISNCPHNFTPLGNNPACKKDAIPNLGSFYLKFGGTASAFDCPLTAGGIYYVNFRATAIPRGTVTTQFYNLTR